MLRSQDMLGCHIQIQISLMIDEDPQYFQVNEISSNHEFLPFICLYINAKARSGCNQFMDLIHL